FPMFGITPLRGRFFGPEDDRVGGPRVAVLSASVWHERFGSDPSRIGQSVHLNGEPFTVVGIAPEGFRFSDPFTERADVWTPMAVTLPAYAQRADSHEGRTFKV